VRSAITTTFFTLLLVLAAVPSLGSQHAPLAGAIATPESPVIEVPSRRVGSGPGKRSEDRRESLRSAAGGHRDWQTIELQPISNAQIKLALEAPSAGPQRVGVRRALPEQWSRRDIGQEMNWSRLSDKSRVGVARFTSPKAEAVRLGIRIDQIPAGAEFRFFGSTDGEITVVNGWELLAVVKRTRNAGEHGEDASTFWTPIIDGDTIGVEVYLPSDVLPTDLKIGFSALSHLVVGRSGNAQNPLALGSGAAAACNLDVMCEPEWEVTRNAAARMLFTEDGWTFLCTGTLINDATDSGIPYFLTANHCISSQASASTLVTNWFYQASACNSGMLGSEAVTRSGGATLRSADARVDTTLLRLNDSPPSGAIMAGWTNLPQTLGSSVTGIHHPRGDLKKISFGSVQRVLDCSAPDADGEFYCSDDPNGNYLDIEFTQGTTEGGSSGSGVFLDRSQTLFGVLYGGNSSCANPGGVNVYGRFDRAYALGDLGRWLNPPASTRRLTVTSAGASNVEIAATPSRYSGITGYSWTEIPINTEITLSAPTELGTNVFAGWVGCSSTARSTCSVTMVQDTVVTAKYRRESGNACLQCLPSMGGWRAIFRE